MEGTICPRNHKKFVFDVRGIDYEYVEYEGESHGFRMKKDKVDSLTRERIHLLSESSARSTPLNHKAFSLVNGIDSIERFSSFFSLYVVSCVLTRIAVSS